MRTARFEEGKSVNVPEYLRDAGNPEAAEQWEKMNELHGDRFKTARMKLIARVARFEEGESVDVPEYLRDAGNPEAAKEWEDNTEEYGDKFKTASTSPRGNPWYLYTADPQFDAANLGISRAVEKAKAYLSSVYSKGNPEDRAYQMVVPMFHKFEQCIGGPETSNNVKAALADHLANIGSNIANSPRYGSTKTAAGKPHLSREGLDKESVRSGNGAMLYFIDADKNHSKFYEMLIAPQGPQFLLKRRWGALTDQNGGLVKAKDEVFPNEQAAQRALATIKLEKTRKGYIDAFGPKHEMNGRKLPMGEYPVGLDRQVGFGWGTQSVVKVLPQLKGVLTQVQQAYQQMERGSSLEMISASIQSAERALKALERNDEGSMIAKLLEQITPVSRMIQEADPDMQNDVKLTLALNRFINYLTKQLSVAHG